MHKNLLLAVGITILFLGVSVQPSVAIVQPEEEINIKQDYLENRLTRKHVFNFVKGYFFIFESKIKRIVRRVILEIIVTGDATIDEIREIINSIGITFNEIYILAEIKTTHLSSGSLACYPGEIRAYLGYNARGSYIRPSRSDTGSYGWFLEINGNKVDERRSGHFFGYFGYIKQFIKIIPGESDYFFSLDGFATLIFR